MDFDEEWTPKVIKLAEFGDTYVTFTFVSGRKYRALDFNQHDLDALREALVRNHVSIK